MLSLLLQPAAETSMPQSKLTESTKAHEEDGPLLLLAGPGTGKTYRLAQRIQYLVTKRGVEPGEITVITFTAAAAASMRARISDPTSELFLAADLQPKIISTMHGLGYRIVLENAAAIGLPQQLEVVNSDYTRRILLEDAAQLVGLRRAAAEPAEECRRFGLCQRNDSEKCAVCVKYTELLSSCGAIDYDDQILLACKVLRESPSATQKYRTRSRHLLVDEYQDINAGQYELIRLLTDGQECGLFAVGDDDQSIYSWRGGSPTFIRDFEKHFGPEARVKPLLHSFRCHPNILKGALSVVKAHDPGRREKGEFSFEKGDGPKILIHSVASDKAEARAIRGIIRRAIPSRDVLVLVPTRGHAKGISEELRDARIRFVAAEPLPGEGFPVLDRLGAWLREEKDPLALRECIEAFLNSPVSGVPSSRSKKAEKLEEREGAFRVVSNLWSRVIGGQGSLWESLSVQQDKGLLATVKEAFQKLQEYGQGDVSRFLAQAAVSLQPWKTVPALMNEVENWIRKAGVAFDVGSEIRVRIMTFQGAKGLEADVVCAVGLEAGTLPRNGLSSERLAEQARLLYVSMTRAKHELHLFHARNRSGAVSFQSIHGPGGSHVLVRSPYLDAVPAEYVDEVYHGPSG